MLDDEGDHFQTERVAAPADLRSSLQGMGEQAGAEMAYKVVAVCEEMALVVGTQADA